MIARHVSGAAHVCQGRHAGRRPTSSDAGKSEIGATEASPWRGRPIADVAGIMAAAHRPLEPNAERLWTAADGTVCILSTCDTPPFYSVTLVRDAQVLRERRLYGRASAQMLAQGWRDARAEEPRRP
jgi:hypothetical protein